ncbi:MAG: hypoxanthine phosphoribosyltransferase [Actinomycetota bacterium]|jgi:hypoxanthine phosphoribosyltransferase|nr:hypoxanthine phosphoribosyltransferase [Actinomycetota bacterium]
MALAEVLYTAEQIRSRVAGLAQAVAADLDGLGEERPLLISVLKGSVIFLADLVRRLPIDTDVDFMSISRYSADPYNGVVRIVKDLEQPLQGRHVVVVEDIVDTGLSLSYLLRNLKTRDPASLRVCTLVDKRVLRIAELQVDYVGFETGEFLIGYGLDIAGRYRNLPYLMAVSDPARLAASPDALIDDLYAEKSTITSNPASNDIDAGFPGIH